MALPGVDRPLHQDFQREDYLREVRDHVAKLGAAEVYLVPEEYATISEAVAAAVADGGDRVVDIALPVGTYAEDPFTISDGVHVRFRGKTPALNVNWPPGLPVIVPSSALGAGEALITLNEGSIEGVTVTSLTVGGAGSTLVRGTTSTLNWMKRCDIRLFYASAGVAAYGLEVPSGVTYTDYCLFHSMSTMGANGDAVDLVKCAGGTLTNVRPWLKGAATVRSKASVTSGTLRVLYPRNDSGGATVDFRHEGGTMETSGSYGVRSGTVTDRSAATTTAAGHVVLAGDLAGTSEAPEVQGITGAAVPTVTGDPGADGQMAFDGTYIYRYFDGTGWQRFNPSWATF